MQSELFIVPEHVKAQQASKNPMVRKAGLGPDGVTCKDCRFLIEVYGNTKKYFKCGHRGITSGAGTDHRQGWDACRLYEVEGEPRLVRAVRDACMEERKGN